MAIRVYNTLSHQKEPFEPVSPGRVGIYLCGPTVYKPSHIGHAVGPIVFDVIKRFLTYRGYSVRLVVNITDVDDKLIDEAAAQGTTVPELAERMTGNYLDAMKRLGIDTIDEMPKASEHIGEIVGMIQKLIGGGQAYAAGGDVYFDVSTDADYGKLSNRRVEDQQSVRDLEGGGKRNAGDFALWKAAKSHEPVEVRYDSPWGPGRPGWHIECSAMSMKYMGDTLDMHGGGLDLIFPHHENEIAQSESATGKPFAKYWLHNGLTRFNTKKVSKSDSEMAEALKKMILTHLLDTHGGELLRYFVLSTHYRRPIEFSDVELESKRKGLVQFHRLFERIERVCGRSLFDVAGDGFSTWRAADKGGHGAFADEVAGHLTQFEESMDDDFNTAAAIAAMFECTTRVNRFIEENKLESGGGDASSKAVLLAAGGALMGYGRLLGLFRSRPEAASCDGDGVVDELMDILIATRAEARKVKQFGIADLIRVRLGEAGITLEDRADGTVWRR
ncbi:MAG: cysteine--tRNA ligase [Phycisphaerales bacterium]|nr:cysteine--tRNA ligase [Phycisphaerales bacterium]